MLVKFGDKFKSTQYDESLTAYKIDSSYMNIDIFPTLLDYMGIPLPTDRVIDGVSMLDALEGELAYDAKIQKDGEYRALYYMKKGVVQSLQMPYEVDGKLYDFKYYLNVLNENSAFIDQHYRNYMFNIDLDPIEGYNVSMTYVDAAKAMKAQLLAFRKELKDNRRGIIR